jgi:hypothetical protein
MIVSSPAENKITNLRASVAERPLRSRLFGNSGAQSMPLQGLNDAKHWRDRAASMRVLSDQIKDPEAQEMMLKLANEYDQFADRAEHRAARDAARPSPRAKDA